MGNATGDSETCGDLLNLSHQAIYNLSLQCTVGSHLNHKVAVKLSP